MGIDQQKNGTVTGGLRMLSKAEGIAILGAALFVYGDLGFAWKNSPLFFLLPDIGLAGYLIGPKIGAITYNFLHSYIFPVLLGAFAVHYSLPVYQSVAIIWIAHIGFDHMLGYGLKYVEGFKFTHLGIIGDNRLI